MSEPLEELRAQRALIQQHLDWLDARIAASEGSSTIAPLAQGQSQSGAEVPSSPEFATKAEASEPAAPKSATMAQFAKLPDPIEEPAAPLFDIDPAAQSSTTSDIRKAQIGCLAIFTIAILGFLFLLFGLPYLVD
ncbi:MULTISPECIES: hypothetical protein [unclassified Lentimonas]|uniref:hypothetical protein n=1 Tax=unclassified Lentimonas TaxID=2630993 RepID=UPI001322B0C6|nr:MULTISPECIES: hypothetical protein [unclassified Lentimonas]CAA6678281.1 Unannotated [Lentimonas sp. CC4]CAA6684823.1 Unannotated [Lentimonas sp. CC6]CAA7076822.1 Unannotated [Lentimonas sp. CC4]CAA7170780.1 Unannotated [Lentimonas sp. CC21]CAA7179658.1 Unannotated [Lentimonas sp. CC8]